MPSKAALLRSIAVEIAASRKCPLARLALGKPVPGEGPASADIFLVGQAPGAEEAETGRPFVGRSGRLLTELLKSAGIDRAKVFITSPEKYFPPKNRIPRKPELRACLPWLVRQIEAVDPEVVVLMGNFAASALKDNPVLRGRTVFRTLHPAAGIRFVKHRKTLERQFRRLGALVKKLRLRR
jgi:DNA polymerase